MCRLIKYLRNSILFILLCSLSCSEYAVEHCEPNQGIVLDNLNIPKQGSDDAKVKLTIFGDFQCPGTNTLWIKIEILLQKLKQQNKEELQIHFRHFPLYTIHDRAYFASVAAAAAYQQGNDAFWKFFSMLLTSNNHLTQEYIDYYAQTAELDMQQFAHDCQNDTVINIVEKDLNLAKKLSLPGTPSVLLCGIPLSTSADEIVKNIEYLINE